MNKPATRAELLQLLGGLTNDQLSATERSRLEEVVASDPKARLIYVEYMDQHVRLREAAGALPTASLSVSRRRGPLTNRHSVIYALTVACTLLAGVGLGIYGWSYRTVAELVAASPGALTVDGTLFNDAGSLRISELTLDHGLARIRMKGGAELAIEGPASLALINGTTVRLQYGLLSVLAEGEARDFVVQTPTAQVTDLGTAFTINARPEAAMEVHVQEGEVDLATSSKSIRLSEGSAARVSEDESRFNLIPVDREIHFDPRRVASLSDIVQEEVQAELKERRSRNDPDLLLYYSFDPNSIDENAVVSNQAFGRSDFGYGQAEGVRLVQGRYKNDTALRFDRGEEFTRVMVDVANSNRFRGFRGNLSVAIWFRCDPKVARAQTLLARSGHLGSNWGFRRQQRGQSERTRLKLDYWGPGAPELWADTDVGDGKWHSAVATFSSLRPKRTVIRFYVDGRLEAVSPVVGHFDEENRPLVIGGRSFGDIAHKNDKMFSGDISMVQIYQRVLSPEEISDTFSP
ncbi:LamG-like jellyroll fold domain-containing protein [Stratiformator vulcanicus]|uniref:FecR protein n=1 Tax=Stratiformator vulcanicus TaxID=2527980 RepID=A0A517R5F5_9PLAN|nr:LamG-like jellyroll fold domain-containing protein [Stratiformator vulcanicus]QDT39126.1 FecR protein [Stratiformator vulcanicus]